ncbi:hypothetical protein [Haloferax sp. DFSO60]|uniref:hypothetical protein n=1 Tax=Haloferax sp. DFSO60 TaxID=3388652 RepID=UPI00397E123B
MSYHTPTKAGVGVAGVGLALSLLVTALLFFVPEYVLSGSASDAYLSTWTPSIIAVGSALNQYGLVALSAGLGYYLLDRSHDPQSVMVGFVIGGLLLGVGTELLKVTLPSLVSGGPAYRPSIVTHILDVVRLGGRLVVGASVGVVCNWAVNRSF